MVVSRRADHESSVRKEPLFTPGRSQRLAWGVIISHHAGNLFAPGVVDGGRERREEETAAILGCARGTVKSRLSRALKSLRTEIAKEGDA
jgi:hypothetical protein